jgi:hypothetical protein
MTSHNHTTEHREERQHQFTMTSIVAIVAGALASISAAVVASFLGVAGTLIGAALVSVVSSLAAALYSGLLSSTQDVVRRTARRTLSGATGAGRPSPSGAGRPGTAGAPGPTGAPGPPSSPGPADQPAASDPAGPRGWRWPFRRPATRWLVVGLAALVMFVVAVGTVTGVEAAIHKPLASAIGGHNEGNARTSVGAALRGSSKQRPAGQQGQTSTTTRESGGSSPSSSPSPSSTSGQGGQNGPPTSTTSPAPSTTGVPPSTS